MGAERERRKWRGPRTPTVVTQDAGATGPEGGESKSVVGQVDEYPRPSPVVRELVELRIHGVSGTPPAGMLDAQVATCVTGDATTGFYVPDPNAPVPSPRGGRDRSLEGYSWRGMTSGSPLQALWVLLAPFALVNTAAAMRPPEPDTAQSRRLGRLHGALVRVLALSLTLTLMMAVFVASIDQVAWQCGSQSACVGGQSTTKYLGWSGWSSPARRVALTLVVPVAAILVLWFLARRAWKARAAVLRIVGPRPIAPLAKGERRTGLDAPSMWEDGKPSEYLRHVHVSAAFSVLSAMTAVGLAYQANRSTWGLHLLAAIAFALLGAAAVLSLVGWNRAGRALRPASVGVLVVSVLVFVALVALLVFGDLKVSIATNEFPGIETAIVTLFLIQLCVIVAIGVVGVLPRRDNRTFQVGLFGLGSAVVGGGALLLGALFSAGMVLRVGAYLGQVTTALGDAKTQADVKIIVPNALAWTARGAIVVAVIAPVILIVMLVVFLRRQLPPVAPGCDCDEFHTIDDLVATSPDATAPTEDAEAAGEGEARDLTEQQRQRARQICIHERLASLTDHAGALLVGPAAVGFFVALLGTAIVVAIDISHYHPAFEIHHTSWIAEHATSWGSTVITAYTVALIGIVLRARKNESLRRTVGIFWDLPEQTKTCPFTVPRF